MKHLKTYEGLFDFFFLKKSKIPKEQLWKLITDDEYDQMVGDFDDKLQDFSDWEWNYLNSLKKSNKEFSLHQVNDFTYLRKEEF
jgi:hypothetical protein